jgi:hypothetical protein
MSIHAGISNRARKMASKRRGASTRSTSRNLKPKIETEFIKPWVPKQIFQINGKLPTKILLAKGDPSIKRNDVELQE